MDRRHFLQSLMAMGAWQLAAPLSAGPGAKRPRSTRVPGLSMGFHNPGFGDPYFAAAAYLRETVDVIRLPPRGFNRPDLPPTHVSRTDMLLSGLDALYGPSRLLYLVNDRDDGARPTVSGMLQSLANTLDVWPVGFVQVGNEEGNFGGLTPELYADLLLEARAFLADRSPTTRVVSAAWFGQESGVPESLRFMDIVDQRGGPERFFDILAVHDYVEGFNVEQITAKRTALGWTHVPIWVTEANTEGGWGAQASWLRESGTRIWDALHENYDAPAGLPPQTVFFYQANSASDVTPDLPYGNPDRYAAFWFESMSSWGFNSADFGAELLGGRTQTWFAARTANPGGRVVPAIQEDELPPVLEGVEAPTAP